MRLGAFCAEFHPWSPVGESGARRTQDHCVRGCSGHGPRWPRFLGLRPRSGIDCADPARGGRPHPDRRRHAADPGASRHPLRLVSPDHPGLPEQWRCLYCFEGKSRDECEPSRRGGANDRLHPQCRGRHIRRRRRFDLGSSVAPCVHAVAMPRHSGAGHDPEPARYTRRRPGLGIADLPVCRELHADTGDRRVQGGDIGRSPRAGGAARCRCRRRSKRSASGCCCGRSRPVVRR